MANEPPPVPYTAMLDEIVTKRPNLRAVMPGSSLRARMKVARALTFITRSHSSQVVSTILCGWPVPLLLTRMSTLPNAASAARTISSQCSASATSARTATARLPMASILAQMLRASSPLVW